MVRLRIEGSWVRIPPRPSDFSEQNIRPTLLLFTHLWLPGAPLMAYLSSMIRGLLLKSAEYIGVIEDRKPPYPLSLIFKSLQGIYN